MQRIKLESKSPKHTHLTMSLSHVLEFLRRKTYVNCFALWRHEILSYTCVRQKKKKKCNGCITLETKVVM